MNIEELKLKLSVDGVDETLAKLERIAELCTQISGFGMDVASCNVIDARDGATLVFKTPTMNTATGDAWITNMQGHFPNNNCLLAGPELESITAIRTGTHAPE